jgi:hypothetical protein
MLDEFFLYYANWNLREDPTQLRGLVYEITVRDEKLGGVEFVQEEVDEYGDITRAIIFLVRKEKVSHNDSDWLESFGIENLLTIAQEIPYENRKDLVEAVMQRHKSIFKDPANKHILSRMLGIYDMAFSSIYGHDYGMCLTELLNHRVELFGSEAFEGPQKLKCYECDQLHFIDILKKIIEGKKYNQIDWLETFIDISNNVIKFRREVEIYKSRPDRTNKKLHSVALKENKIVEIPLNLDEIFHTDSFKAPHVFFINSFRQSLISAAFYSLTEFLLQNDRRKLKFCDGCYKFYISKTIRNQRFCSSKCRMKFHNQRRIESGEHREYKRKKRMEGAKESYYG